MALESFRELRVWQVGMEVAEEVYRLTASFPREEIYGLTSQMRRAAVSVPSNIAEGYARDHLGEYLHHLSIAQGSLSELETQLEIAQRLGYGDIAASITLMSRLTKLSKQLFTLRRA